MLLALGVGEALLLSSGRPDFVYLHITLNTAVFMLSAVLSLLLADIGMRMSRPLLRWLAVTFTVTSVLELLHVLTTVDFASRLTAYPTFDDALRIAAWPPSAYCLAVGTAVAVGLAARGITQARWFGPALILFTVVTYPVFLWVCKPRLLF